MESQGVAILLKEIQENKTQGLLDTMHSFVSYYYQKFYQGTEIMEVFDVFYVDYLKFELCFLLGAMASYAKQRDLAKFIEKLIIQVKIDTYTSRNQIATDWLNSSQKSKYELTNLFLNKYPHKDQYALVKEDLGLQLTKKELKKKLEKL